ncbi:MAG: histidinol dehydrogenase, partial [Candidatus Omnitrophica bacterium]|nr:histidinol dehydrogenase [Candidatus Omnitrophota bacterium]
MKVIKPAGRKMQKILERDLNSKKRIQQKVSKIIDGVRSLGDEAVLGYTRKFDRVKLTAKQLK